MGNIIIINEIVLDIIPSLGYNITKKLIKTSKKGLNMCKKCECKSSTTDNNYPSLINLLRQRDALKMLYDTDYKPVLGVIDIKNLLLMVESEISSRVI